MNEQRFIRMGPYRFDLFRVVQYSPLDEDRLEIFFECDQKLILTFKNTSQRNTALEFIDKASRLYAEAGDKLPLYEQTTSVGVV